MNPQSKENDKGLFHKQFDWPNSSLTAELISQKQTLLIESYDIIAKHLFDAGYNTELKVRLTPAHDIPVYNPSQPTPSHLRDEMLVELDLMQ